MNNPETMGEQAKQARRRWWPREGLEGVLYRALSTDFCGNDDVPCTHLTFEWKQNGCDYVASTLNDVFELGIGYPTEWHTTIRRENARQLAWFILWRWWIVGEWFGLRRAIWYWLLHRRCARWKKHGPV